tara:strand:+ start:167 stop:652 length:486 start_codon:yes stop_codon:yes gene_type:complete
MSLQQRYDRLTPAQKREFERMKTPSMLTNWKQLTHEQIIAILERDAKAKDNGEFARVASRPMVLNKSKWQEILKKKKKPFKGYNKKIHARTGGLSAKGRAHFKRKQGSNLKPPVTTKPSKLKPGSKAAKRRKSFCARSRGFKRDDGTYSEKAKAARRRWNC